MPGIGAANDLADEPPVGAHVVAVLRSRLPDRLLLCECVDHRLPVERLLEREVALDVRQTRLVRHHLRNGDRLLPVRARTPARCRRRVVSGARCAVLHQQVRARRGDALRRGVHEHERVLRPRRRVVAVGRTAPEIDDRLTIEVHAHRRAHLAALVEVLREHVEHRFELRRDVPVDRHPRSVILGRLNPKCRCSPRCGRR